MTRIDQLKKAIREEKNQLVLVTNKFGELMFWEAFSSSTEAQKEAITYAEKEKRSAFVFENGQIF